MNVEFGLLEDFQSGGYYNRRFFSEPFAEIIDTPTDYADTIFYRVVNTSPSP